MNTSQKRSVVLVPALASSYIQVFVEIVELATDEVLLQKVLSDLLSFCEVISRTALIHELRITPFSLGTAVARGLSDQAVSACLKKVARIVKTDNFRSNNSDDNLSNNNNNKSNITCWDPRIETFISRCMKSFTRARLVIKSDNNLKNNNTDADAAPPTTSRTKKSSRIVVECDDRVAFNTLSCDSVIQSMMLNQPKNNNKQKTITSVVDKDVEEVDDSDDFDVVFAKETEKRNEQEAQERDDLSFELQDIQCVTHVVARSFALGMPLRRQYDFEADTELRRVNVALRPSANPRPYQKAAVESAIVSSFSGYGKNNDGNNNDVAIRYSNSGVIVIPCGGGKTLIGVMCFAAIRRRTVILCVNAISVEQWKEQIEKYAYCSAASSSSTANNNNNKSKGSSQGAAAPTTFSSSIKISLWTAKKKDPITDETDVVITTYHALAGLNRRRQIQQIAAAAAQRLNNDNNSNKTASSTSKTASSANTNRRTMSQQFPALHHPLLTWSWGLVILDEAHVVPATYFRDGVSSIAAKCSIGLTATFVREDDKIGDLQHLCGPKLFDIGWEALRDAGFLASVKCREVIVPLPNVFQAEYWNRMRGKFVVAAGNIMDGDDEESSAGGSDDDDDDGNDGKKKSMKKTAVKSAKKPGGKKLLAGKRRQRKEEEEDDNDDGGDESSEDENMEEYSSDDDDNDTSKANDDDLTPTGNKNLHPVLIALAASNPNKILCAKRICQRHRGQKILIFCDIIALLLEYASQLKCPAIHGGTAHAERVRLFSDFENTSTRNILCVSRVGEIAINLPSARVVIQVSSHGGSRRQEVQRLGRVLRPKLDGSSSFGNGRSNNNCNQSWFYSLVSSDTIEVEYASRRSRFLIDQGYETDQEVFDVEIAVRDEEAHLAAQQNRIKVNNSQAAVKNEGNNNNVKNENNIHSSLFLLNREWILAWLVKVIARWELDFAPELAAHRAKNKKGKGKPTLALLQAGETRQQRTALSKWTVGREKDAIVYDEA